MPKFKKADLRAAKSKTQNHSGNIGHKENSKMGEYIIYTALEAALGRLADENQEKDTVTVRLEFEFEKDHISQLATSTGTMPPPCSTGCLLGGALIGPQGGDDCLCI